MRKQSSTSNRGPPGNNSPWSPSSDVCSMAGETTVTRLEVENGLRQHDLAIEAIKTFLEPDRPFALRPSLTQQLQSVAVQGIEAYPGQWRTGGGRIEKSRHI